MKSSREVENEQDRFGERKEKHGEEDQGDVEVNTATAPLLESRWTSWTNHQILLSRWSISPPRLRRHSPVPPPCSDRWGCDGTASSPGTNCGKCRGVKRKLGSSRASLNRIEWSVVKEWEKLQKRLGKVQLCWRCDPVRWGVGSPKGTRYKRK